MRLCELIGLKSRQDFKGDHREYYGSIVKALGFTQVASCVPYDIETLDRAYRKDKAFNNLSLKSWDAASGFRSEGINCIFIGSKLTDLYRKHGVNVFSNSDGVCILKECAREMVEMYREKEKTLGNKEE